MDAKKNFFKIILTTILVCFLSSQAMASKICLEWEWNEPNYQNSVQFKIYYSELLNLPFLGTFINQGPSPFTATTLNTNGTLWSTCLEMPTPINSYYTVTAYVPGIGESAYSNTIYVDFTLPPVPSDKAAFQIQWSN